MLFLSRAERWSGKARGGESEGKGRSVGAHETAVKCARGRGESKDARAFYIHEMSGGAGVLKSGGKEGTSFMGLSPPLYLWRQRTDWPPARTTTHATVLLVLPNLLVGALRHPLLCREACAHLHESLAKLVLPAPVASISPVRVVGGVFHEFTDARV